MGFPSKIFSLPSFCIITILTISSPSLAQTIYVADGWPHQTLWTIEVSACSACNLTEIGPLVSPSGDVVSPEGDIAICPDGSMYVSHLGELFTIDPTTGICTSVPGMPNLPSGDNLGGLACAGDGILYGVSEGFLPDYNLYEFNVNNNTLTILGLMPFHAFQGMFYYQDDLYMCTYGGLVLVDTINPSNSSMVFPFPPGINPQGATVYGSCNALLLYSNPSFYLFNMLDGSIIEICSGYFFWTAMTSLSEFLPEGPCTLLLDLDCDDSSGADDADYDAPAFTCLTPEGVPIADEDMILFSDVAIDQMTISISTGFIPDGPDEILDVNMATPNIEINGIGTSTLILNNINGMATFNDYIDAVHAIVYINTSIQPTAGIRTIEVVFTNESGDQSILASAYVPVEILPLIQVNLGDDLVLCDDESTILNAGNPGSTYLWSTQQTTQTITVNETDIYSVTVTNGIDCPNADTVTLEILPVIEISLTGDPFICDNEIPTLTILLTTSIPVDIEIESNAGGPPFVFNNLTGNHSFTDPITGYTEYELTTIEPSSLACIQLSDSTHAIEVFPTHQTFVDTSICEGDSVWLGTYWQTNAGTYGSTYPSANGCDSIVTTHIEILPEVMIFYQRDTCDANAAGVFITLLENPDGCDTIIQTTISLLPSDTTNFTLITCVSSQADIDIDTLTNAIGCDSFLITTTIYQPPSDTTHLSMVTCDSALLGFFYDTLLSTDGCDSIVALTIQYATIDTTYTTGQSCIPANIGVFTTVFTDAQGCDSVVIRTVTPGTPDTIYLFQTSCDPASLGVFEDLLISSIGCDSLIITTVTFSAQDSTFLSAPTCDPLAAGVFVSSYTNQFGCDSIVTETVTLNISHQIDLASYSCYPADTGVFVQLLTNQFGCDSIITATVSLLPSDQTNLSGTTCLSSEAGMFITTHLNQYGCDSIVTLTVSLVQADTTQLNFNTCDPAQTGSIQTLLTGQDGCDSLVIQTTSLFPLPVLIVQSAIDYNGFDISCEGGADGSAIANINGAPPYTYHWSTNDPDQMITGLSAGDYDVAITDGNGCMTEGTVTLTEPDVFMIGFEVSEPDCFDQQLGNITVLPSGGVEPYSYSIDGTIFQTSPVFTGLDEGIYQITSLDANDCSTTEIISIDVPLMVNVELGTNQSITIGDSTLLEAIINLPFDSLASVMWTGIDSIGCANCLTQIVAPIITTAYSVSVTSADGCADRDSMTVFVSSDYKIYIPNIFSPNGDGVNDVVMISADESVREITSFSIFDRWGNLVFGAEHFQPNDSSISWDGRMKGEGMNPGVFTFRVVVEFSDGHSEIRYGDITLMR